MYLLIKSEEFAWERLTLLQETVFKKRFSGKHISEAFTKWTRVDYVVCWVSWKNHYESRNNVVITIEIIWYKFNFYQKFSIDLYFFFKQKHQKAQCLKTWIIPTKSSTFASKMAGSKIVSFLHEKNLHSTVHCAESISHLIDSNVWMLWVVLKEEQNFIPLKLYPWPSNQIIKCTWQFYFHLTNRLH